MFRNGAKNETCRMRSEETAAVNLLVQNLVTQLRNFCCFQGFDNLNLRYKCSYTSIGWVWWGCGSLFYENCEFIVF